MNSYFYNTRIGRVKISENGTGIVSIGLSALYEDSEAMTETPLLKKAALQLSEYLDGRRTEFDLPLDPQGTPFQKRVWDALKKIPYGETRSYRQIAEAVGNPLASRAVGQANNKNPILIVIPCHRVIGADGNLTGYGAGLPMKKFLLELEASLPSK